MPKRKNASSAHIPMQMIIIVPGKRSISHISCEIDSDGISIYRDEPDPDDMTDYGYLHRNQPKKHWEYPGYGDDD